MVSASWWTAHTSVSAIELLKSHFEGKVIFSWPVRSSDLSQLDFKEKIFGMKSSNIQEIKQKFMK